MSITGNLKSYELTILLSKKQKLRLTKSWDWATYVGKTGIFGDNSIAPNHRDTGLLSIVSIQSCQYTMELKNEKLKKHHNSNFCQKPFNFLAVTQACYSHITRAVAAINRDHSAYAICAEELWGRDCCSHLQRFCPCWGSSAYGITVRVL